MVVIRRFLLPLLLLLTVPALAQKTTPAQPMAAPGESTEPPPPKAAPIGIVQAEALPRAGGVIVFGGTRGTGLEAVKALVARHEKVTVLARGTSDTAALKALGVSVVTGNALDSESLKTAFTTAPFRAVISTLGTSRGEPSPDFDGNKNVVDAAKAAGVSRVILVTAIGVGDSAGAEPWFWDLFLKDTFATKTKAENYLRAAGLDFTVIRPGGLLDRPGSGKAVLNPDKAAYSWISRADLGKLLADCVDNNGAIGKTYTAFDPSRTNFLAWLGLS